MRKLIHPKFELDISGFELSDNEENNWFSDSFFSKYSFPFDIDLTNEIDAATGFISQFNSSNTETYFEVKYVHDNTIEDAVFEVEAYEKTLSCIVRYGFEQLPSFDKKLSELSLDKFDLPDGSNIYNHAQSIITKTWPDVNYNFPQIHVDKYNQDDDLWTGFQGILNNRVSGNFLENSVDIVEDVTYNRNVMQPLPYWLHILQRGMYDAGFTLGGQILNDSRLKSACLYADVDYFKKPALQDPIDIMQMSEDAVSIVNGRATYQANKELTTPGKYNISGTVKAMRWSNFNAYCIIKYRNTVLWYQRASGTDMWHGSELRSYDIDLDFETLSDLQLNDITIENYQPQTTETQIIDLVISLVRVNDSTGVAIPTVINENKVDLTKAVPNKTFVEFVKDVKNYFNYDLTIVGKMAIMDRVEDKINTSDTLDFRFSEVKTPTTKYNSGISFLLKFQDIDSKEFKFLPVFHNKDVIINSNFTVNEKTTTIEIAALPLPIFTRNGIQTAYAFESNDSKSYLVNYDGIFNNNNYSKPIDAYLLPLIHADYWKKWFNFRIKSKAMSWNFKEWIENIYTLTAKTKIFAYNRFHIIKTINRTEIQPDLFDIELETDTLE